MSFARILWRQKNQIISASHLAILYGMLDTWKRCNQLGNKPEESDFVAGFVLESAPLLYQSYSTIFQPFNIQISLAAVFCHQTPKVKFAQMTKSSCEVGDLLIIHIHTNRFGKATRNALLYQAKVSSNTSYTVPSSEQDQLKLYEEWPNFEYWKSPPLTGQKRDVMPKIPHMGAQYMLIDGRPPNNPLSGLLGLPGTYPIGSCMADEYLQNHNHLAGELFDFLHLRSGRTFSDYHTSQSSNGWSRLIWDLIHMGIKKAFNRKNSGRHSSPRYSGAPLNYFDGSHFAMRTSHAPLHIVSDLMGEREASEFYEDSSGFQPESESNRHRRAIDGPSDDLPGNGVSLLLLETTEMREEGAMR